MQRRRFLEGLALGLPALSAHAQPSAPLPRGPRVNGGIHLQPLRRLDATPGALPLIEPDLVDLQLRALFALGFEQMRVSIPFERFSPNFLAAIPYCRAARALGLDVVGVMTDFGG